MTKRARTTAPGSERSLTVTVKSLRNPPLDLRLAGQGPNTSVLDIKALVADETGIPAARLRLLHAKKPVPDSRALKELLPASAEGASANTVVELTVMVLGGGAAVAKKEETSKGSSEAVGVVAQGPSGEAVVETDEFWADLQGFLQQRIRDEKLAGELSAKFKSAWATGR